jgi:predicted Zn finger-like uncharacterized protein
MKISCDSCGAKYTIADAKVQGRKVKVRCKSCKATILVDGNSGGEGGDEVMASDPPAAAAVAAPIAGPAAGAQPATTPKPGSVKKDAWSVNLSDDDSRDMTTAELIAGWKSGLVTQDAYAWKDGMADWKPILEIPELKQKLLAGKPLRADPVVSSAKLPPSPGRAAPATDDLFGGVDLAGSEIEAGVGAARPAPKAAPGTGARNESSVLFSLDSLTGGGPQAAPTGGGADIFGGLGGGGLLATNTDLLTAPAKEPPPAPVFKPASIRPVASGDKKSSMPIVLAIIGAAVVIGGVLFFVMGGKDEAPATDPAAAAMAAELEKTKAALEKSKADEEAAKKKAAEEACKLAEAEAAKKKAAEEAAKKPEDKPTDGATASTTPSGSSSSPSGSSSSTTPAKPAAPSGGGAFDVGAAKAALAAAAANAAGCGSASGPKGSGKVQVTFAPSGRVTSANVVSGPFGGTSVGGCVASKFRAARVPAFSGSPQTVAKGFTVN